MNDKATRAKQYRTHAAGARAMGELSIGPFRESFMQLAYKYEKMADEIEAEDQSRD
jgi:hypothetical protein